MTTEFVVEMKGIRKEYPGVKALSSVDFTLKPGEVHCLLGENGAGKSTLIKILSGAVIPDGGEIRINGKEEKISSPIQARRLGVSPIYQELDLIGCLSAAENIFLGNERLKNRWTIDWKSVNREAQALVESLGIQFDVRKPVDELSVALKQMVAIAKAMVIKSNILIMDEPSAVLSDKELEILFEIIEKLKRQGMGIIYISHRLEEIFRIGNRLTVLRDGQWIATRDVAGITESEMIAMMVGRELKNQFAEKTKPVGEEVVLSVRNLSRKGVLHEIGFDLRKGEILGISGLVGAGRTELARCLVGADPIDSGTVKLEGVELNIKSPKQAKRYGIGYVPEERKVDGLVLNHSVKDNAIYTILDKVSAFGVLKRGEIKSTVRQYVDELLIKTPTMEQKAGNLSGGNQQKIVIAKWMAVGGKVLILDEPTRGVDVGAKAEIYRLIARLADEGLSIVMISSEIPEILNMSNRILVMSEGRITRELRMEEATQEEILRYAIPQNLNARSS